ncbi:MAG TPA: hypothetical protein VMD59_04250 [Acidimicrobiales bacterium]|nr:hypothetical protein [Acidimicrobiales bacterium]
MPEVTGSAGELLDRLLDLLDVPGPQLRAVVTTLLVTGLDPPGGAGPLLDAMVASDDAAAMIDPGAAAEAALRLRAGLRSVLDAAAAGQDESSVVRTLRDYLLGQVERWATRSVDDADTRRRAERFLAWAERPELLAAAQSRGLFVGMDADELRVLAARQASTPVSAETALQLWSEAERWRSSVEASLGDEVLEAWQQKRPPAHGQPEMI